MEIVETANWGDDSGKRHVGGYPSFQLVGVKESSAGRQSESLDVEAYLRISDYL
jgi:hypothetical protein